MFSFFVTFTEVVKLSVNIYYRQREVNYTTNVIDTVISKEDIKSAASIIDIIEDRSSLTRFIKILKEGDDSDFVFMNIINEPNLDTTAERFQLFIYSCGMNDQDVTKKLMFEMTKEQLYVGAVRAIHHDNLDVLNLILKNNSYFTNKRTKLLSSSIQSGKLNSFKYLIRRYKINLSNYPFLLQLAIDKCKLNIIEFIVESKVKYSLCFNLRNVIVLERLDILIFLRDSGFLSNNRFRFSVDDIIGGNRKILEFLSRNVTDNKQLQKVLYAAINMRSENTIVYLLNKKVKVTDKIIGISSDTDISELLKQHKS